LWAGRPRRGNLEDIIRIAVGSFLMANSYIAVQDDHEKQQKKEQVLMKMKNGKSNGHGYMDRAETHLLPTVRNTPHDDRWRTRHKTTTPSSQVATAPAPPRDILLLYILRLSL